MSDSQSAGTELRCWAAIGVWGDRTCPELPRVGHCRNCEVYGAGGDELLARPVPPDYLHLWTELLASKKETAQAASTSYLVFRVGQSWLGLRAMVLREVTQPGAVCSLPHRRSNVLMGLTAVRGEVYPCVSLHALMGDTVAGDSLPKTRFLVALHQGGEWVFPVDEVTGIYDVPDANVEQLPATLSQTGSAYTMGIAQCGGRPVGLIEEELLFSAVQRRIA